MRKIGKIVLLMLIVFAFAFTFTSNVNAADELDYSGYEEIGGDDASSASETPAPQEQKKEDAQTSVASTPAPESTQEQKPTEEPKKEPETNNSNPANTSTSNHVQAGSFVTIVYAVTGVVAAAALGLGYAKLKKYNF